MRMFQNFLQKQIVLDAIWMLPMGSFSKDLGTDKSANPGRKAVNLSAIA